MAGGPGLLGPFGVQRRHAKYQSKDSQTAVASSRVINREPAPWRVAVLTLEANGAGHAASRGDEPLPWGHSLATP